ncbi:hypothetical protein BABINDRAFT_167513 [Babjeviella inositovora NRRL Y-12698]|uniref:Derlin n=1 Tax=Babjeviella inositovora NRRL Y-12698 TaxID=984486 RepID=A0A1E3QMP3_9ASCO|nr:uncharacterized protein BABINDRAFT_167513 [Babjeviella inositovora NRRL Y-12698]ODQ78959.1 hypothetical protein BABINDRAFT_167513 [Babjeviella inositovora NRRL Y-12698]
MTNEIVRFVHSIPPVTQFLVLSTFTISLLNILNIIPSIHFINYWPYTIYKAQLWRPFTTFFIASLQPLQTMMDLYSLYSFSSNLESEIFQGDMDHWNADYIWFIVAFNWLPILVVYQFSWFLKSPYLLTVLLSSLSYTWSRYNKTSVINFYFVPIRARNLPIAGMLAKFIINGTMSFMECLVGCAVGYGYSCISTKSAGPLYYWLFPLKLAGRVKWEERQKRIAEKKRREAGGKAKKPIATILGGATGGNAIGGSTLTEFNDRRILKAPLFFQVLVKKMEASFALPPTAPAPHNRGGMPLGTKTAGIRLGSLNDKDQESSKSSVRAEPEPKKKAGFFATSATTSSKSFQGTGYKLGSS